MNLALLVVIALLPLWYPIISSIKYFEMQSKVFEKCEIREVLAINKLLIYNLSKYYRNLTCGGNKTSILYIFMVTSPDSLFNVASLTSGLVIISTVIAAIKLLSLTRIFADRIRRLL